MLDDQKRSSVETFPWSERLAHAERARRDGKLDQAVRLLEDWPAAVQARDEARQWPELCALMAAAGKPGLGTTVHVRARGVLHVTVNHRHVPIPPTGRVGELLVFLLEHDGAASLDAILDAFYPNAIEAKDRLRARKMVWEHANALRALLGWRDAVLALGGAYQLDPQTSWLYDIREARGLRKFDGEFLAGVFSEWALEVAQELHQFSPVIDAGTRLN
jgi:hypothetical protein